MLHQTQSLRHGYMADNAIKIIAASALSTCAGAHFYLNTGCASLKASGAHFKPSEARKSHHVVHLRTDADPLAQRVVVVAWHMGHYGVAVGQPQCV